MPNAVGGVPSILSGDVKPSRFVKWDDARDFATKQAGSGDVPSGVSQEGSKNPPGLVEAIGGTESVVYAGRTGDTINIYRAGDLCNLRAGTGGSGWDAGDFLKPDADGAGVPATSGDFAGATALHAVGAGEVGSVLVIEPKKV